MVIQKINMDDELAQIAEHWRPKVVASLNGQEVKLVKFQGEFVWHHHEKEDEMFMALRGRFQIEFRDKTIELKPGEILVVPKGMEHRTVSTEEVSVLVFEPAETRNTGNVESEIYTAPM